MVRTISQYLALINSPGAWWGRQKAQYKRGKNKWKKKNPQEKGIKSPENWSSSWRNLLCHNSLQVNCFLLICSATWYTTVIYLFVFQSVWFALALNLNPTTIFLSLSSSKIAITLSDSNTFYNIYLNTHIFRWN